MGRAESYIEQHVVDWAKARGVLAIKFTPRGEVGWPDHIFIIPPNGKVVFIEFKAPGEEPTPIQAHRIHILDQAGGNAYWTDSIAGGIEILTNYMEP